MAGEPFTALVVDDETNIRLTLATCLRGMGATTDEAATPEEALRLAAATVHDIAFVDLRLGEESGLDLIAPLLAERPHLAIVVITAYASIETAVEAVRRGASDYLPKPFTPGHIRHVVERVRAARDLSWRVVELERRMREEFPETELATSSPRYRAALDLVARAAGSDAPVLFRGESGTGKGVLARALHLQSRRRARPFVTVNCPLLTADLLASELFGHVRGAFTGASVDRTGRIDEAQGGTLLLDEVSEIAPSLQAKLLRFVQERRFERVGESRTRVADVRVVAATNRDLESAVRDGHFREDLLYRLNVIEIEVPALRDRPEDVVALAQNFLAFFASRAGCRTPALGDSAVRALVGHSWPGNVRELRNAMERAVILGDGGAITGAHLLLRSDGPVISVLPRAGDAVSLQELEDAHVRAVVSRAATLDEAAQTLGIDASTLWRKRKRLADEGGSGGEFPGG